MLTRANLSAEIAKRRADLRRVSNVSAQEVIAVLAAQMRSDITEFLGKDGSFDLERIRSATLGRLIKKLVLRRAVPINGAPARNNVHSAFTYVSRVELYSAQSAAIRLCKVLGIEHEKDRTRNDPETLRKLLEERIQFGIEGFRRGGVVLTRRDMLELFSKTPESAGELYPLIQADLAALIQAELESDATSPMQD
jgi:hypothetical protein